MKTLIQLSILVILLSGCAIAKPTKISARRPMEVIATTASLGGLLAKVIGGPRQWELDRLQHEVNVLDKKLKIEKITLETDEVKIKHDNLNKGCVDETKED